jgi:hypothetical protein
MKSKCCFLALIDLLGFSKLISERNLDEVEAVLRRFQHVTRKLVSAANENRLTKGVDQGRKSKLRVFSDLILVHTERDSQDDCMDIIEICSKVFLISFQNGLLPRGAIAWGEMIITPSIVVGSPLVEAHFLETQQNWVGISLCDSMHKWNLVEGKTEDQGSSILEVMEENFWLIRWPVPTKSKSKVERLAINWLNFDKIPFWHTRFSNQKENEYDSRVHTKLKNTEKFYEHLSNLKVDN